MARRPPTTTIDYSKWDDLSAESSEDEDDRIKLLVEQMRKENMTMKEEMMDELGVVDDDERKEFCRGLLDEKKLQAYEQRQRHKETKETTEEEATGEETTEEATDALKQVVEGPSVPTGEQLLEELYWRQEDLERMDDGTERLQAIFDTFRDPEVGDDEALGHAKTALEAWTAWYMVVIHGRGREAHANAWLSTWFEPNSEPCVLAGSTLTANVNLGKQVEWTNECGSPWLDHSEYHYVSLWHLGSYREMIAHRLCHIAKSWYPAVETVEIIAWCPCLDGRPEDSQDEEYHRAGRLVVPVSAHPAPSGEPLPFDRRVKITVYDSKRRCWCENKTRVFRRDRPSYRCARCASSHAKMLFCKGCLTNRNDLRTAYCSKECQRADWKQHKRLCKKQDLTKEEFTTLVSASLHATPWMPIKDHLDVYGLQFPDGLVQQTDGYQMRFKRRGPEDGTDEDMANHCKANMESKNFLRTCRAMMDRVPEVQHIVQHVKNEVRAGRIPGTIIDEEAAP